MPFACRFAALVPPGDRKPIKDNLVQLMCNCPGGSSVKSQLSEAISLISKADFPKAWTNLLPDLIGKFSSTEVRGSEAKAKAKAGRRVVQCHN